MRAMPDPRPPFRADHVGSLLRPPSLKALRLEKEAGRATAEALAAAEDAAIRDAVALQEGVGLQGITVTGVNGVFTWDGTDFAGSVSGVVDVTLGAAQLAGSLAVDFDATGVTARPSALTIRLPDAS